MPLHFVAGAARCAGAAPLTRCGASPLTPRCAARFARRLPSLRAGRSAAPLTASLRSAVPDHVAPREPVEYHARPKCRLRRHVGRASAFGGFKSGTPAGSRCSGSSGLRPFAPPRRGGRPPRVGAMIRLARNARPLSWAGSAPWVRPASVGALPSSGPAATRPPCWGAPYLRASALPLAIGAPSFVVGMAAGRSLQRAHPAATMRSRSAAGVVACAKAARSAPLSARRCPLLAHRSAAPAQRGPPYSLRCGRSVGSLSVGNSALSCPPQPAPGANLRPLCNSAQQ